jgi:hypothetical protein
VKNKLADLNDHLFAQIERLANEELTPEQLETEVARGGAIVAVADRILQHASLQVQAAKILAESGDLNAGRVLPELGTQKATRAIEGPKQ